MRPLNRIALSLAVAGLLTVPGLTQSQSGGYGSNQNQSGGYGSSQNNQSSQSGMSRAASQGQGTLMPSERNFLRQAAQANIAAVELGKLAQTKASSDQVRKFADQMVQQHGQNLDDVKSLAQQKGLQVPTGASAAADREKARLEKLNGAEFDHAYINFMADEHKKDVAKFRAAESSAKDPDVKAYIGKTLPTLQQHEQLAVTTQQSVNQNAKANR